MKTAFVALFQNLQLDHTLIEFQPYSIPSNTHLKGKLLLHPTQLESVLNKVKNVCRESEASFLLKNDNQYYKEINIFLPGADAIESYSIELKNKQTKKGKLHHSPYKTPLLKKALNSLAIRNKFICLIGPDGVGKSTILSALKQITPSKPLRYKSVFRKSFSYKTLYFIGKRHFSQKNLYDDAHSNIIFFTSLFRLYQKSLLSFITRKRILSDRYANDHLASLIRSTKAARTSTYIRLKSKLIPAPSVIIQLDAPAHIITSRRDELTEETIDYLSDFYLKSSLLIKPKTFVYLNTNTPLDQSVGVIEHIIKQ